jgi:hypothetical protein
MIRFSCASRAASLRHGHRHRRSHDELPSPRPRPAKFLRVLRPPRARTALSAAAPRVWAISPPSAGSYKPVFSRSNPFANSVAASFYRRLFEPNPLLVPLFQSDMQQQGIRFMEKLAVAVVGLEDLDSIGSLIRSLGRGHAGSKPSCGRSRKPWAGPSTPKSAG